MLTTALARTRKQSFWRGAFAVVHSCRRKFFKHVHNLFTHALGSSSPAGLRLEISCESDKKKMNFIFNFGKKIFLTGKRSARVVAKTRNSLLKKFREPAAPDSESPRRTEFAASWLRIPS
jgi:hypothetical protein